METVQHPLLSLLFPIYITIQDHVVNYMRLTFRQSDSDDPTAGTTARQNMIVQPPIRLASKRSEVSANVVFLSYNRG